MRRIGFAMGIAAVAYALPVPFVLNLLDSAMNGTLPGRLLKLAQVALAVVLGIVASRALLKDEEKQPPAWFDTALVAVGSLYLLWEVATSFLRLPFGKAMLVVDDVSRVSLAATMILVVRFLPPRVALFLGLAAIALQFHIGAVLGLAALAVPRWLGSALTVGGAALIAFRLASSETSAAVRVRQPALLWAFGAAGLLTLMYSAASELVPEVLNSLHFSRSSIRSLLAWLVFLGIFLALASRTEPQDADVPSSSPRAGAGTLLAVFLGLYVMIGLVFEVAANLGSALRQENVFPMIVCAVIAAGAMLWMRLPVRIPEDAPGRGMLIAGLVAFAIAFLGGWRIVADASGAGSVGPLLGLLFLVLLVAPLVAIGTTLVGVGMFQVMFNLDPMPASGPVRKASAKR